MMKPVTSLLLFGALLGFGSAAMAQEVSDPPSPRQMMLAAGYKAMFTCSATFNAGKTPEQIAAHELDHIYPDYEPAMALLPDAVIDRKKKLVSVQYSEDMPPRVSVWQGATGCVAMPAGTSLQQADARSDILLYQLPYRPSKTPWPAGDVVSDTPLPADKQEALGTVVGQAFAGDFKGRTTAVVIVQDGDIVAEQYIDGFSVHTSQRTWSVAKSIAASVIGAAVQQDILTVEETVNLADWQDDPRQAMTLENLLHMASGLDSEPAGNRTDDVYFGGGLVTEHATKGALLAPPGEKWRYANNDTMLAMLVLKDRMDNQEAYLDFPFEALLNKIGMFHTNPETDWQGNFVLSSQVWTTARDLARLGMLYLNDGVWDGERILPEGWADYVSTPAPAQPPCRSDNGCRQYGAQFWLYKDYPGVPNDTYAALGNRGQFLIIVPSRDVVIVRRGYDWRENYFDGPVFTAAVLEALE